MEGSLKFGIGGINGGTNYPDKMARLSQAAEKAGFDSIWAGGHPFLSEKQSRISPAMSMLDPVVSLAFIAAHTRTIRLATGILLIPQLNPLVVAKELASLDVLSGGRLIFGTGVGWSEHEYEVLGVPYHDRGAREDDYLKAIKVVWTQSRPVYKGKFISFSDLQSNPHPLQRPCPPIIIGGNSPGTFRRAVEMGNGWFGYGLNPDDAGRAIAGLREATKKYQRPAELGELEITITPPIPVEKSLAEQYSKLGVHRLNLTLPSNSDVSQAERFIQDAGNALVRHI
jgi:probable F420-dependent oxidoreductase